MQLLTPWLCYYWAVYVGVGHNNCWEMRNHGSLSCLEIPCAAMLQVSEGKLQAGALKKW